MPNFLPFYTEIWSDKKFRSLPDSDHKIVYIYLFFHPAMTLTGIYNLDIEECKLKTKVNNGFDKVFQEVVNGKYNIVWDIKNELIWVKNRFARIPTKSPKVIVGAIIELNHIKHSFKDEFIKRYREVIEPYMFRYIGHKTDENEYLQADFLYKASKIYTSKESLKNYIGEQCKEIPEERIDKAIQRHLPNLK